MMNGILWIPKTGRREESLWPMASSLYIFQTVERTGNIRGPLRALNADADMENTSIDTDL